MAEERALSKVEVKPGQTSMVEEFRPLKRWMIRLVIVAAFGAEAYFQLPAQAQAPTSAKITVEGQVIPAPTGMYVPMNTKYILTEPSNLYLSWFTWAGKIEGNPLPTGREVTAIAQIKDHDWVLIGQNGVGIGYLPTSVLKPKAH